jgi:hypothetical protein
VRISDLLQDQTSAALGLNRKAGISNYASQRSGDDIRARMPCVLHLVRSGNRYRVDSYPFRVMRFLLGNKVVCQVFTKLSRHVFSPTAARDIFVYSWEEHHVDPPRGP